jgi:dTDP-4-dehydrorhamnose reductase
MILLIQLKFKLFQQDGQIFGTYNLHKSSDENLMHWDGSNINELENLIENLNPIFVINCIGFAQVDLSEMFPEKAFMLNSILPYEIGRICYKSKVKLVHISTDHFNGHNTMALSEDDPVASPNIYSVSKLLGEKYVLNEDPSSIVVRANFFHFTKN